MNEYIELQGASGSALRFRLRSDAAPLPAMAGNFVCIKMSGDTPEVVACGATNSLMTAGVAWEAAVREHGAEALYIRLNVAGATRALELESLVKHHNPPMVVWEGPTG
ncbi:hypothetical protein GVN21_14375 [Caulobacter sp. SLTY]|uniref:hypothetical protein n=1 Tax=Caulobacter sp. SLTY TaxID=2683262 RepID=UPI0014128CB4|nr:hypothetical protein [Caulobacter sp. SLTY]NBB16545.1 hypothetical protein [Caulobacter sp. SLTY]